MHLTLLCLAIHSIHLSASSVQKLSVPPTPKRQIIMLGFGREVITIVKQLGANILVPGTMQ